MPRLFAHAHVLLSIREGWVIASHTATFDDVPIYTVLSRTFETVAAAAEVLRGLPAPAER